jgi:hypothetical protein
MELVALAFPLGAGSLTFLLFILSWVGIPLNTIMIISLSLILVLNGLAIVLYRYRFSAGRIKSRQTEIHFPWNRRYLVAGLFGIAVLAIAAALLAVLRSYSTWDAIAIWGAKGYGISLEGSVFAGKEWGAHGLQYSLNIPLLIGAFHALAGDQLPGSKLIFPFFYLSILLGVFMFVGKRRATSWAVITTIFIGTIPLVFEHATIGYANLPLTVYLTLGLLQTIEGIEHKSVPRQFIAGLLLGFASWTRPEGIFITLVVAIVILLMNAFFHWGKLSLKAWLTPMIAVSMTWFTFSLLAAPSSRIGDDISVVLHSWTQFQFNIASLYWTLRYFVSQAADPLKWGILLPLIGVALLFWHKQLRTSWRKIEFAILVSAIAVFLAIFIYYYISSFTSNIHYLLGTSVERLFLPAMLLGVIWVFIRVSDQHDAEPSHEPI